MARSEKDPPADVRSDKNVAASVCSKDLPGVIFEFYLPYELIIAWAKTETGQFSVSLVRQQT